MQTTIASAPDYVMLACLRGSVSGGEDTSLPRALGALSTDDVERWEAQGIMCYIAETLDEAGVVDHMPATVRSLIHETTAAYQQISDRYLAETVRVVERLEAELPVAILKDSRAFSKPHMRPSYDYDLLVAPDDAKAAASILESLGYTSKPAPFQEAVLDREKGLERYDRDLRFAVDLHWDVLDSYRPRNADVRPLDLLARRTKIAVNGVSLPVLDELDFIVTLCLHTCEHELRFPTRLITWLDVAQALRRWSPVGSWDDLISHSQALHAEPEVFVGLEVSRRLFLVNVPPMALERVRPKSMTLGLEAAFFGYWNYVAKYVDDCARHQAPGPGDDRRQYALGMLAANREAYGILETTIERVAASGEALEVFADQPVGLVPAPAVANAAQLDVLVSPHGWAAMAASLEAQGFIGEAGNRYTLKLHSGPELVVQLAANTGRSPSSARPTPWELLSGLVFGRVHGRLIEVFVHVASDRWERAAFLCSRMRAGLAVDLYGLLLLADDEGLAGGPLSSGWHYGAQLMRQPATRRLEVGDAPKLLELLDARSCNVEALTKYLVIPATIRVLAVFASTDIRGRKGRLRLLRELLATRGLTSFLRDVQVAAEEALRPVGRRVPPRLYLTRDGAMLTSLR